MADDETRHAEETAGETDEERAKGEGAYELDLDEGEEDTAAMDELFQDALDAVEKTGKGENGGARRAAAENDPELVLEEGIDQSEAAEIVEATSDASGETAELRDRLIRTMADFDNYRKRTEREKRETRQQAASRVLKDFLEVVDNLERALASSAKLEDLKQGVEMILRQKMDILRRHGVEKVKSVGEPFDPNVHEAVAREEGPVDLERPTVKAEMQPGYLHGERLLRPAMVTVAVPPTTPTTAGTDAERPGDHPADDPDADAEIDHGDEHTVIGFDA